METVAQYKSFYNFQVGRNIDHRYMRCIEIEILRIYTVELQKQKFLCVYTHTMKSKENI